MSPIELSLRQAFGAIKVGIGQICAVEFCQAQIRTAQIRAAQRGPDQERATEPCIAEVGPVEPCIAQSGPTQVCLTEVCPGEHGGIELSAAHISFTQAGTPQHHVGHQPAELLRVQPCRDVAVMIHIGGNRHARWPCLLYKRARARLLIGPFLHE